MEMIPISPETKKNLEKLAFISDGDSLDDNGLLKINKEFLSEGKYYLTWKE